MPRCRHPLRPQLATPGHLLSHRWPPLYSGYLRQGVLPGPVCDLSHLSHNRYVLCCLQPCCLRLAQFQHSPGVLSATTLQVWLAVGCRGGDYQDGSSYHNPPSRQHNYSAAEWWTPCSTLHTTHCHHLVIDNMYGSYKYSY